MIISKNKIYSLKKIKNKIIKKKKKKKTIVHCHGVFDVLHYGHIKHFKSAKKNGDFLIVSITSDEFVNNGKVGLYLIQFSELRYCHQFPTSMLYT